MTHYLQHFRLTHHLDLVSLETDLEVELEMEMSHPHPDVCFYRILCKN
jgi:hypothetical protein